RLTDLRVVQAACDEGEDLPLAVGQALRAVGHRGRRGAQEALDEAGRGPRGEQRVTGGDGPDGVEAVGRPGVLDQEAGLAGAQRVDAVLCVLVGGEAARV